VGLNVHKVATLVGFETVVCDDRELYANPERFPDVHETDAGQSEKGKQSLMLPTPFLETLTGLAPIPKASKGQSMIQALFATPVTAITVLPIHTWQHGQ